MGKGRPRKEIDQSEFEKLCGLQCTLDEIAGWFACSPDTIERWCRRTYKDTFAEVYKLKCGAGKIALRRYQMKLAERYPAMAIWMGKQYLDQRDRHELTATATGQLAELIDGMKEPCEDDIYSETAGTDGAVADE